LADISNQLIPQIIQSYVHNDNRYKMLIVLN